MCSAGIVHQLSQGKRQQPPHEDGATHVQPMGGTALADPPAAPAFAAAAAPAAPAAAAAAAQLDSTLSSRAGRCMQAFTCRSLRSAARPAQLVHQRGQAALSRARGRSVRLTRRDAGDPDNNLCRLTGGCRTDWVYLVTSHLAAAVKLTRQVAGRSLQMLEVSAKAVYIIVQCVGVSL
jgi:hypothetical protein